MISSEGGLAEHNYRLASVLGEGDDRILWRSGQPHSKSSMLMNTYLTSNYAGVCSRTRPDRSTPLPQRPSRLIHTRTHQQRDCAGDQRRARRRVQLGAADARRKLCAQSPGDRGALVRRQCLLQTCFGQLSRLWLHERHFLLPVHRPCVLLV